MKTVTMTIDGMHCDGCAKRISTLLGKESGVREAFVSFVEGLARIQYNPHAASENRLVEVIERGGFTVSALRR